MKDEVLKRKMFSMPLSAKTTNVGIMSGFEDEEEDMDEAENELTRRSPQSPEILMNNLRGDIRSVDARYEELAQMVGDEAAMDTPPEVLALLQGQMAQQQPQAAGIGALPQAPQMPPDMGAMMGGQPQGMPPQGMPPMPPQGMPPQAPMPMDQGMQPPVQMAQGGYVQKFANGSGPQGVTRSPFAFSPEQLAAMPGYNPSMPPDAQAIFNEPGLETAAPEAYLFGGLKAGQMGASGLNALRSRYFTARPQDPTQALLLQRLGSRGFRGMAQDLAGAARSLPGQAVSGAKELLGAAKAGAKNLTGVVARNPVKATAAGVLGAGLLTSSMMGSEEPVAQGTPSSMPPEPQMPPPAAPEGAGAPATEPGSAADMLSTITGARTTAQEPTLDAMSRTKKYASDYQKLFSEYLKGDKDAQQTQALLLLADAGLKLASTAKPGESFASALARSAEGVPAGLAQLGAKATERETAIKMMALQSAIERVASEDKAVRDIQLKQLESQSELFKFMLQNNQLTNVEDLGAGLTRAVTKGGEVKFSQDPNVVAAAQRSPFTLNPATNPFTTLDPSRKPQVTTNKQTRAEIEQRLFEVDALLGRLGESGPAVAQAFGMPAAAVNFYNNVFVPLGASPNMVNAASVREIRQTLAQARPVLARIGGRTGRLSNQQEEWQNAILGDEPGSWFSSPEIAGKNLQILNTDLLNYRQELLGQLGLDDRVIRAQTPGLGTANDPMVVPSDPQKRTAFANMIAQQFAGTTNAPIFLRSPSGETARFTVKGIIDTYGQR